MTTEPAPPHGPETGAEADLLTEQWQPQAQDPYCCTHEAVFSLNDQRAHHSQPVRMFFAIWDNYLIFAAATIGLKELKFQPKPKE